MARFLLLVALVLAALFASLAQAFMAPAPMTALRAAAGARERTQGVAVMACRFNAKREKRKRNGENARKYRMKSSGPKFLAIKTRKRASKADYSKRLEQYEMDFTAQIYRLQDVDALLAAASPTDDA